MDDVHVCKGVFPPRQWGIMGATIAALAATVAPVMPHCLGENIIWVMCWAQRGTENGRLEKNRPFQRFPGAHDVTSYYYFICMHYFVHDPRSNQLNQNESDWCESIFLSNRQA